MEDRLSDHPNGRPAVRSSQRPAVRSSYPKTVHRMTSCPIIPLGNHFSAPHSVKFPSVTSTSGHFVNSLWPSLCKPLSQNLESASRQFILIVVPLSILAVRVPSYTPIHLPAIPPSRSPPCKQRYPENLISKISASQHFRSAAIKGIV